MPDLFTWGVWMTSESPIRQTAKGSMTEENFRRLLATLTEVTGSTDKALDRIKEIMVCELNKIVVKHGA